jgi:hypothetical protein
MVRAERRRHVHVLEQVRHGADMVLVAVRQEHGLEPPRMGLEVLGEVGK